MFDKIEHIGIAVKDLETAIPVYEKLLGAECYKREEVESEGVITAFLRVGESKIELLQATRDDSAIARSIEKRGEGFHHIAFAVQNVEKEMERLKNEGFRLLNEHSKAGADEKQICFIHPKDASGVLVEMCQDR